MKKNILILAIAMLSSSSFAVISLVGHWQGKERMTIHNIPYSRILDFTVEKGDRLSGNVRMPGSEEVLTSIKGQINGTVLHFFMDRGKTKAAYQFIGKYTIESSTQFKLVGSILYHQKKVGPFSALLHKKII